MSASENVRASLMSIGFVQLALLFGALIAYGVALGEAFPRRVRDGAAAAALIAAGGFVATAPRLADGVVILALAVALVGAFGGAAWLLSRLLHVDAERGALPSSAELALASPTPRLVEARLAPGSAGASGP